MYYSIRGTLILKEGGFVVLECGGVGYEIQVGDNTLQNLPEVGHLVTLYTRLIVRENDLSLVGFANPQDRRLYDTLVTVSGIGLKQSLRILSELSGNDLRNVIITGDVFSLSRVKGIGNKTAQRIILELKDKMSKLPVTQGSGDNSNSSKVRLEVLMALRVLGYSDTEAQKSIDAVVKTNPAIFEQNTEVILKEILASMVHSK